MFKAIFALVFAWSVLPMEASAAPCTEMRKTIGAVRYQVIKPDNVRCWHSFGPTDSNDLFYRDFLLDNQGYLLAFTSYGLGNDDITSGGREFYFFPRSQEISAVVSNKGVQFTMTNGVSFLYSAKNAKITNVKGADIRVDDVVKEGDQGGFEIKVDKGIVLDFGFNMGGAPSAERKGKARFIDSKGNECSVYNGEILNWDLSDEPTLKSPTDAAMKAYLATRCPNLIW